LVNVTFAAYQPVWHAGYIWDDAAYVSENRLLTAPDGLQRIWFSLDSPSQYFPLTFSTFYLEHRLWGLDPARYHLVNLLLHAANAMPVWRVLARLRVPGAWLGAAMFALHPVQVESVAWITERKNVLTGLFFLLTLLAGLKIMDEQCKRPWRFYVLALALYALALSAKTTACTLPATFLAVTLSTVLAFFMLFTFLYSFVADHYQYLACIGPIALASVGIHTFFRRFRGRRLFLETAYCAILLATQSLLTWRQSRMYRDMDTFWRTTIDRNPGCWLALNDLGASLYDQGQTDQAILLIQRSLALHPDNAEAENNLGAALDKEDRLNEAVLHFKKAVAIRPYFAEAHRNLGATLLREGQADPAIREFQEAVAIPPDDVEARNNLSFCLLENGRTDEAIAHLRKALEIQPDYAQAHYNLGNALLQKGQVNDAIVQFQKLAAPRPGLTEARRSLSRIAWRLATSPNPLQRNGSKALELARQMDQLARGSDSMMAATLAAAYAETGDFNQAVTTARRALQLATRQDNAAIVAAIQMQLNCYQAGSPYRDPVASP
jgi:Flp pilus assembly protein TadD